MNGVNIINIVGLLVHSQQIIVLIRKSLDFNITILSLFKFDYGHQILNRPTIGPCLINQVNFTNKPEESLNGNFKPLNQAVFN